MTGENFYKLPVSIGIIGDKQSGKTAIIKRYIEHSFSEEYIATTENTTYHTDYEEENQITIYDMVDTSLIDKIHIMMIVYDSTNQCSINNAINLKKDITNQLIEKQKIIGFILVGNKSDLESSKVNKAVAEDCRFYDIFDVSAKTGDGVKDAFVYAIEAALFDLYANVQNKFSNFGGFFFQFYTDEELKEQVKIVKEGKYIEEFEKKAETLLLNMKKKSSFYENYEEKFREIKKKIDENITYINENIDTLIDQTEDEDTFIKILKYRDILQYLKDHIEKEAPDEAIELSSKLFILESIKNLELGKKATALQGFKVLFDAIVKVNNLYYDSLENKELSEAVKTKNLKNSERVRKYSY